MMKRITFYLDFISPYAYLAFERLPQVLQGLSYEVRYQPVLLAGMLSHFGQKGPAEIEPKRAWTFRHVAWLAHQHGVPMQVPAEHPFNPLPLLRLALAASAPGHTPNRWVCEQIFHHVWRGEGAPQNANDPQRLADLTARLADSLSQRGRGLADPQSEPIKQALKQATQDAIDLGVFGVPHLQADGRLYFGLEGLDLLSAALRGEPWFDSGMWDEAAMVRPGVKRG
jgi:2-hydroxychromene-2-carboxylate isomerase